MIPDCKPGDMILCQMGPDGGWIWNKFEVNAEGVLCVAPDGSGYVAPKPAGGTPILPSAWPKGVRLQQDFGLANTVTPVSVPGMSIELPAGEYVVQYYAVHQDTTPEQGHQTRLSFNGVSCYSVTSGIHGNTGLTGAAPNFMAFPQAGAELTGATGTTSETIWSGTGVQFGGALITTLVVASSDFTLSLQTSQTANGTNTTTTMKAGSWLSVMPLNALAGEAPAPPVPALADVLATGNDCAGRSIRSLGSPLDDTCAVPQGLMNAAISNAVAGITHPVLSVNNKEGSVIVNQEDINIASGVSGVSGNFVIGGVTWEFRSGILTRLV